MSQPPANDQFKDALKRSKKGFFENLNQGNVNENKKEYSCNNFRYIIDKQSPFTYDRICNTA